MTGTFTQGGDDWPYPWSATKQVTTDSGSIMVTIAPQDAQQAGAAWRRVGSSTWFNSGATESNVATGSHTLEFKSVTGWTAPSNQTVSVTANQTATATATYTKDQPTGTGSIQVNIEPQEARNAGAQWRRVGTGAWFVSGATEANVATGSHTLEFKSVTGWTAPSNQTVSVTANQTATATATYTKDQPTGTGSILVNIEPQEARQAGAAWRRYGTMTWFDAWTPESVPAGRYGIEFKDVEGFTKPSNQTVNVQADQTAVALGRYERESADFGGKQWIIAFYVAYWNRAADPDGLKYWMNQISAGNVDVPGVAENFALSAEAKGIYQYFNAPEAATDAQRTIFVQAVYGNLLNRIVSANDEGVLYWVGELRLGRTTPGLVIGNMIHAAIQANSTDWLTIWNKVQVAEYFAARFEARSRIWQEGDLDLARQSLQGVTDDPGSAAAGKTRVDQMLQ